MLKTPFELNPLHVNTNQKLVQKQWIKDLHFLPCTQNHAKCSFWKRNKKGLFSHLIWQTKCSYFSSPINTTWKTLNKEQTFLWHWWIIKKSVFLPRFLCVKGKTWKYLFGGGEWPVDCVQLCSQETGRVCQNRSHPEITCCFKIFCCSSSSFSSSFSSIQSLWGTWGWQNVSQPFIMGKKYQCLCIGQQVWLFLHFVFAKLMMSSKMCFFFCRRETFSNRRDLASVEFDIKCYNFSRSTFSLKTRSGNCNHLLVVVLN